MNTDLALRNLVEFLASERTQWLLEGVLLDNPGFEKALDEKLAAARSALTGIPNTEHSTYVTWSQNRSPLGPGQKMP